MPKSYDFDKRGGIYNIPFNLKIIFNQKIDKLYYFKLLLKGKQLFTEYNMDNTLSGINYITPYILIISKYILNPNYKYIT